MPMILQNLILYGAREQSVWDTEDTFSPQSLGGANSATEKAWLCLSGKVRLIRTSAALPFQTASCFHFIPSWNSSRAPARTFPRN